MLHVILINPIIQWLYSLDKIKQIVLGAMSLCIYIHVHQHVTSKINNHGITLLK